MGTKLSISSDDVPPDPPRRYELRELEPGTRFMFYADDLAERGPCTLISKGAGGAIIKYEPHKVTKKFKARNFKTGEMEEKEITQYLSGESRCALGAQVVPLPPEKTTQQALDDIVDLSVKDMGLT